MLLLWRLFSGSLSLARERRSNCCSAQPKYHLGHLGAPLYGEEHVVQSDGFVRMSTRMGGSREKLPTDPGKKIKLNKTKALSWKPSSGRKQTCRGWLASSGGRVRWRSSDSSGIRPPRLKMSISVAKIAKMWDNQMSGPLFENDVVLKGNVMWIYYNTYKLRNGVLSTSSDRVDWRQPTRVTSHSRRPIETFNFDHAYFTLLSTWTSYHPVCFKITNRSVKYRPGRLSVNVIWDQLIPMLTIS